MNFKEQKSNRMYYLNTKKYCGAISVDKSGKVTKIETAPCYKRFHGQSFTQLLKYFKTRKFLILCKRL